jgi:tetratricopeptide (TPR) repeat protein
MGIQETKDAPATDSHFQKRETKFMVRAYLLLFMAFMVSGIASGKENAQQELARAFQLDYQGQFAEVIELAKPLTTDEALTALERGRSWMVLAHAYQEVGNFQEATTAYEQSLHLLENDESHNLDYARTLSAFSTLYRHMGQLKTATGIQKEALHLYEQGNNHAGAAVAYGSLAELALSEQHTNEGRKYLAQASKESKLAASDLDDNYFASVCATRGWLAELDGNPTAAISWYQNAIALSEKLHGEKYHLVGWDLMQLGKAYAEAGDLGRASENMRQGLAILGLTAGHENAPYFAAELAYARVLDASGEHSQAAELRKQGSKELTDFYRSECVSCRISATAVSLK